MPKNTQRLSDAVMRGFGKLIPNRRNYLTWMTSDPTPCGCALGAALLGCISLEDARLYATPPLNRSTADVDRWYGGSISIITALQKHFPWFTRDHEIIISAWFHGYAKGEIPYQSLIERIRKLEEPYMKEETNSASSVSSSLCEGEHKAEIPQDQSYLITA